MSESEFIASLIRMDDFEARCSGIERVEDFYLIGLGFDMESFYPVRFDEIFDNGEVTGCEVCGEAGYCCIDTLNSSDGESAHFEFCPDCGRAEVIDYCYE